MPTNVIMPQLGESVVEGTVSRWLKSVGDQVAEFEPLCEVSTDKVDTEIPSPAEGVLLQIIVPEGTTVERGTLLAVIGAAGETIPVAPLSTAQPGVEHAGNGGLSPVPAVSASMAAPPAQRYSPVVTRMAAENRVDLSQIKGSGLGGRVTRKDVEAFIEQRGSAIPAATPELAPWEQPVSGDLFKPTDEVFAAANQNRHAPAPAPAAPMKPAPSPLPAQAASSAPIPTGSAGEIVPHSPMRRLIAEHMVRSKLHTAPHVTTVFEIDMQRVWNHWQSNMAAFEKQGVRLTLTAYFVMAMVKAVQTQPVLNSQWTDDGLWMPGAINVGMAVALNEGLIVPVIKNAQDLNLTGTARQVTDLAARARARQLKPDDTVGGTITLTNHGVSGSLFATPVINQPQSAIVGTGAVQKRAVVLPDTDSIAIRPMMYATLTFDHRVADGALADAFMVTFKTTLENWT